MLFPFACAPISMFPRFSPFNPMDLAFALASSFTMSTGICLLARFSVPARSAPTFSGPAEWAAISNRLKRAS